MAVPKRLVLIFPGFEPLSPAAHLSRFTREATKTAPHYGMRLAFGEPTLSTTGGIEVGQVQVHASGEGWHTDSDIVVLGLSAMPACYARRNPLRRLFGGLWAMADIVATGTLLRYVRTSWRYGFFFLYPLLMLLACVVGGAFAGWLVGMAAGSPAGWLAGLASAGLSLAVVALRTHLLLALDLWSAARDLARGRRPEVTALLHIAAAEATRRIEASEHDEVVLCAHSFGTITAIEALAALPEKIAPRLGMLAAGSNLYQVALHPSAKSTGRAMAKALERGVAWLEVQSLTDVINFYGSDPARDLVGRDGPRQKVVTVRFRNQLKPETYKAIRRDLFRVHRQFMFGVEKRSHFALHAILCGPERFEDVVARGGLAPEWRYGESSAAGGAS